MHILKGTLRSGNFSKNRIDAFSDGVFAIVITLLVIEIRVPHIEFEHLSNQALFTALLELTPKFLSFVLSFLYIAIYWVNHHILFHMIKRADRGLFWFNSLFLMCLAFIPFPTALIGEYPSQPVAVVFYGIMMFITAVSFVLIKWYAVHYANLVDPQLNKNVFKESIFKAVIGPILYFLAIIFSFINTHIAILIYIIIPIIYFIPGKFEKQI